MNSGWSIMLRKQLFLVLVLALAWVPVLQAAHALTHVGEITPSHIVSELETLETMESAAIESVIPPAADEAEGEADNDRLCLDCLALTGFSIIFSILVVVFSSQTRRQARPYRKSQPLFFNSYTPYSTRAPPVQAQRP
jgi:hypothetical protein